MNKAEIVKDKLVSEQLTDSAQTQVLIDNKTPLAFLKYFNTYRAVTADAHLDAEKRYDDALKRLNPPKKVRDRWPIGFGGPAIWDRARIQNKALSKAIRAKLDATPPTRESREISMINIERGPYREADDELKQRFKNLINGTYAMRESELSRSVGLGR